jgi:hypothetical protein
MNELMRILTSRKLEANMDEMAPDGAPPDQSDQMDAVEPDEGQSWRDRYGEELKPTLERYSTEQDFGKAFMELRKQNSQRMAVQPKPDNGTEEDLAKWREAVGIPEEPGAYLENLPEGTVLGEDDKVIFSSLAESLHSSDVKPDVLHGIIDWYNGYRDEEMAAIETQDASDATQVSDLLREEMGVGEFRANINIINSFIESELGEEMGQLLVNARGGDGKALFNNPEILKFFAKTARQVVPQSTIVGNTEGSMQGMMDRKKELEGWMGAPTGSPEWKKYWEDKDASDEYLKILTVLGDKAE